MDPRGSRSHLPPPMTPHGNSLHVLSLCTHRIPRALSPRPHGTHTQTQTHPPPQPCYVTSENTSGSSRHSWPPSPCNTHARTECRRAACLETHSRPGHARRAPPEGTPQSQTPPSPASTGVCAHTQSTGSCRRRGTKLLPGDSPPRKLRAQGTGGPAFSPGAPGAGGRGLRAQGTGGPVFTPGAPGAGGRGLHAQGTGGPVFSLGAPGAGGRQEAACSV